VSFAELNNPRTWANKALLGECTSRGGPSNKGAKSGVPSASH